MSFGDTLKALRKERDISQEQLAELLNVSRQAVSKWEQGAGYPEVETLLVLSRELNVSLDTLMGNKAVKSEAQNLRIAAAEKITIRAQDGKTLVSCYKVMSFPVSKAKNAPKYSLFGVDGRSFLDENRVFLGWYADEESIQKEISSIQAAMERGEATYSLRYAARVKNKFLSVELDE